MLKELIKSSNKKNFLIPIIEQQVLIDGAKETRRRRRDVFHPSDISYKYFCPRRWVIGAENPDIYLRQKWTPDQQLTFAVGTAQHSMMQELLGNAGVLFGFWKCKHCFHIEIGFKPEEKCKCGLYGWEYEEVSVVDPETNVHGHTDGIIFVPEGKFVWEFKTMRERYYRGLVEPLDNHQEQSMWYLDTLERNNDILVQKAKKMNAPQSVIDLIRKPYDGIIPLYINKNDQSMKEFIGREGKLASMAKSLFVYSNDKNRELVHKKRGLLIETYRHFKDGTLPEKTCENKSCPMARNCVAKKECFERDE